MIRETFRKLFGRKEKAEAPKPPMKVIRIPDAMTTALNMEAKPEKKGRTNHSKMPHTSRGARFCKRVTL